MNPVDTVVFDMGGVLMEWKPLKLARDFAENDADAALIANEVFGGPEWLLQDAGAVSSETVAWAARRRLPDRLGQAAENAALHWYEHRHMFSHIDELIRELKADGFGIYLLSNAGVQFSSYKHSLPAVECFDGMVVSAFEHVVKPDPELYMRLINRYGLTPAHCLFVDDVETNVAAAQRIGMRGYVYDGNVETLRSRIYALHNPQR